MSASVCACACLLLAITAVQSDGAELCGRQKRDIMFPNYNEPPSFYDQAHRHRVSGYHHHQHHGHDGAPLTDRQIPSDLMRQLNEVESFDDFMQYVTDMPNTTFDVNVGNRFGSPGDEDTGNVDRNPLKKKAEFAKCTPEEVTIPLHLNITDVSEMYFPTCTRVKRCGGCCTTTLYSCQPTETETLNLNVMVTEFKGGSHMMSYKRMEMIAVEQHTACKCGCKLKAVDCNRSQVYKKSECLCECLNVDERQKCIAENDTKLWDYHNCICLCREERECSTGYFFNPRTCRCMQIPATKRRAANSELDKRRRRGENGRPSFQPRPVVPLPQLTNENDQQEK